MDDCLIEKRRFSACFSTHQLHISPLSSQLASLNRTTFFNKPLLLPLVRFSNTLPTNEDMPHSSYLLPFWPINDYRGVLVIHFPLAAFFHGWLRHQSDWPPNSLTDSSANDVVILLTDGMIDGPLIDCFVQFLNSLLSYEQLSCLIWCQYKNLVFNRCF